MEEGHRKRVIVVGAGLSGLSAARQLLTTFPQLEVTVLEALDRVGGRTHTVDINGFAFDEGAEYIGQSQKYVLELAKQSGNELVSQYHQGTKLIQMQNRLYRYESDIPSNLNIFLLIELQTLIWKINRMASKVSTLSPKDCQLGYQWDAISVQTWLNQNVRSKKLKAMIELSVRSVFGAEPCEMSFLYLLWYVHENRDFDNLINIRGGLQEKKTKLGTQHMSKYLADLIRSKGGRIELGVFVKSIEQKEDVCCITDEGNKVYECDYVIMACSPWQANKIEFLPQLSMDRKLLCERSFMGSYIKVILLYKRAYWKEKGMSGELLTDCFDSPLMTAFDDTKHNEHGETQPALIVFLGGYMYRIWKERGDLERALVNKIAEVLEEPEMMEPVKVQWKAWQDEQSIGGGPTGIFGPGVLSQVDDLRRPEGRIHWAGTEMATVSTGYMDGAIESGLRAAKEVEERISGVPMKPSQQEKAQKGFWYTKYLRAARKWIEWL